MAFCKICDCGEKVVFERALSYPDVCPNCGRAMSAFTTYDENDPKVEEIIRETATNIHGISKIHELKTIDMGVSGLVINMQIEVDSDIPVKDADDIADPL